MAKNIVKQCVISQIQRAQKKLKDPKILNVIFDRMYPLMCIIDCINTQGFLLNESIPRDKTYRHERKHLHKQLCKALKSAEKRNNGLAPSKETSVRLADYYSFLDEKMEKDIEMLYMQVVNYCTKKRLPQTEELYRAMMIDILCQFGRELKKLFSEVVSQELCIPYSSPKEVCTEDVQIAVIRFIGLYDDKFDYINDPNVIACTKILYNKITESNLLVEAMEYSKNLENSQITI